MGGRGSGSGGGGGGGGGGSEEERKAIDTFQNRLDERVQKTREIVGKNELIGSEKQVAWAEEIRDNAGHDYIVASKQLPRHTAAVKDTLRYNGRNSAQYRNANYTLRNTRRDFIGLEKALRTEKKASTWINHRNQLSVLAEQKFHSKR